MAKKKNGNGKVIGLVRDYSREIVRAPYVLLKKNGEGYLVDGAPKCLRDLMPFIDSGIYRRITFSAREYFLDNSQSRRINKLVKKLEIVKIDLGRIK